MMHQLVVGGTHGIGKVYAEQVGGECSVIGRSVVNLLDGDGLRMYLQRIVSERGKLTNLVFFQRFRHGASAWEGEIKVTLEATMNCMEYIAEHQFYRPGISVVMVSSVADTYVAPEQNLAYHVGKAGLSAMMRWYAVNFAPGFRVNAVSPCVVRKPEAEVFWAGAGRSLAEQFAKKIPLGRMGTPEDIVEAINFLHGASYVTGQNIVVDGGLTLLSHEGLIRGTS